MTGQKFLGKNRAPRVQIEYDVEVYGSQKKVQLPFVMGVLSNLAGNPATPLEPIENRSFEEIDISNFDSNLKKVAPRAAFHVPNTLTGEGNLSVELNFASLDDFSPGAVAKQVEPLAKLLEARQQLSNLLTYMDGKSKAEELLSQLLKQPELLSTLGQIPNQPACSINSTPAQED